MALQCLNFFFFAGKQLREAALRQSRKKILGRRSLQAFDALRITYEHVLVTLNRFSIEFDAQICQTRYTGNFV